jgi:hypothetical protein
MNYNDIMYSALENELLKIAAIEELAEMEKEAIFGLGASAALKAALKGGAARVGAKAARTAHKVAPKGATLGRATRAIKAPSKAMRGVIPAPRAARLPV